jgi:hypothetical protein
MPADMPVLSGQPAQQLSHRFWQLVDYSLAQADSLGLQMGIHICDGFALAGGPWISPEESMQQIVWKDTVISGGHHHFDMQRPAVKENYYEDIALYAIPITHHSSSITHEPLSITTSPSVTLNAKGVYCADEPGWLQYSFKEPTTVRCIEIEPSGNNIQCQRLLVRASDDGIVFHTVKQLTPPRQGWQNTGFNTTFSIPPTTARYFRFEWTPEGSEPGAEDLDAAKWKPVLRVKSIRLLPFVTLDNYEGKAGYVWRIAPDTPDEDVALDDFVRTSDVVCGKIQSDNLVDIELPEGQWRLLRMGHTSTGHTNATGGGAKGLECDKFSQTAVEKQIDWWFGQFMKRPHHSVIKYMHVDSWECGSQNWSKTFAKEFERRRGYDILPLLPIYAGVPMKGGDETLRDIRRTVSELVTEVFFATVAQKAKEYGVQLSAESTAPTMVGDGMSHYKYADMPMGEFWLNSPTHDKPNDMLDAISGAHVYGKNIVQAEGFTEVRGVWDETLASIKPLLDRNLALGMNRLFFHVFTHNPYVDKKPGMTLDGIGLFFQRDQTWFPEAKAFVDYVTRCQQLLQQGRPVVDLAVYTGEDVPCRAMTPDKVVPLLPGLFGADRVESEKTRLANHGLPMTESPVGVRHSAGILDMKDWVNAMHGYQYDSMNKDALLNQPFNYKVLVIPEDITLSREVRNRLETLEKDGILILRKPYMADHFIGLPPDVALPEGIAYCHRTSEEKDIYFLANQKAETVTFAPIFRENGKSPVFYNPQTDEYHAYSGQVTLEPYESVFVIFESPTVKKNNTSLPTRPVLAADGLVPQLTDLWTVTFRENNVTLNEQKLFDWSQHWDNRIRYFSGHAWYSQEIKLKEKEVQTERIWLTFPNVKDCAHVWVNGKDCGTTWTAPYQVEITGTLQKGRNTIEIEVVNTWHNALRGAEKGLPPYEGIWTNAKYRTKGDGLLPAGLIEMPVIKTTN